MVTSPLQDGARAFGLQLTDAQLRAFQIYQDELLAWNEKFNLTSITEPSEIVSKHFLDSLSLFSAISYQPSAISLMDIGAGAGFPALPLKIARPEWRVTLLEATRKKCDFLEHVIATLQLSDARVVWGRAETIAHEETEREQYDLVVARAVAELNVLVEFMLPFARVGGQCIAWKGETIQAEVNVATRALHPDHPVPQGEALPARGTGHGQAGAIEKLGGRLSMVKQVHVPGIEQKRHLVLIDKVAHTQSTYPRREGVPSKKPLK
jgi:16S rRNA (guanine527-N7)-methyltransferase